MKVITKCHGTFRGKEQWTAYDDDTYDGAPDSRWPSNCIGIGDTPDEAEADLREQIEDPKPRLLARILRSWLPYLSEKNGHA